MEDQNHESLWPVDFGGQLADVKQELYDYSVLVTALVDLLVEKGWMNREEILRQMERIDQELTFELDSDEGM